MFNLNLYNLGYCDEKEYTRVVCVCWYQGKYLFSYNKKRNGWEIPGGHIEKGETWMEAVKREMYEETGATKIRVEPICVYKITDFRLLCYCEIKQLEKLPNNMTFPDSFKIYFNKVMEVKDFN